MPRQKISSTAPPRWSIPPAHIDAAGREQACRGEGWNGPASFFKFATTKCPLGAVWQFGRKAGSIMSTATATAKIKGPIVWLDMDQQELDDAYDQAVYAPNRDQGAKRRLANAAIVLARLGKPSRFAYGPTEIEALDVYRTKAANAPIAIFVHGGAWRNGTAAEFTSLAEPFVNAGAHFVVLDFINVDQAGGSLFPMVEQVRRAVGWVYRNADKFGGDKNRIQLLSHSSGSHLSGCTVTHDWSKDGLPMDIIKGAALSSGMYDLKPVRLSKRSKYVAFTDEMEQQLSAIRHLDKLTAPLILKIGRAHV